MDHQDISKFGKKILYYVRREFLKGCSNFHPQF
jgi:hypothetical protein